MSQFTIFTAFINGNCIMTIKQTNKFYYHVQKYIQNKLSYFIFLEVIFSKAQSKDEDRLNPLNHEQQMFMYVCTSYFFSQINLRQGSAMYSRPNVFKHMYLRFHQSNKLQLRKTIQAKKSEFSMDTSYICIMYIYVRYICTYMYFFL